MLFTDLEWTVKREADQNFWPGGVRLHSDYVLGEWFCLRRSDGALVWEHPALLDVNCITGIVDDVIVCARLAAGRQPGRGACALDVASGSILWSSSMTVSSVRDGRVWGSDGDSYDLRTGEKTDAEASMVVAKSGARSQAGFFWQNALDQKEGGKFLGKVENGLPDRESSLGDFFGRGAKGEVNWEFSASERGWNIWRTRNAPLSRFPYLYMLGTKEMPYRVLDIFQIEYVPCSFFLLILDASTGRIVQELDLGVWVGNVEFGGVDEFGAVIRFEKRMISYLRHYFQTES